MLNVFLFMKRIRSWKKSHVLTLCSAPGQMEKNPGNLMSNFFSCIHHWAAGRWTVNHQDYLHVWLINRKNNCRSKYFCYFGKHFIIFIHVTDDRNKNITLSFFPVICSLPNRLRQPLFFCSSGFWRYESHPCLFTLCPISTLSQLKCRHT